MGASYWLRMKASNAGERSSRSRAVRSASRSAIYSVASRDQPLDGVAGDDPHEIGILARDQVPQHGLALGVLFVGLAPGAAGPRADVLQHQIDVAVQTMQRHDRERGTHTLTPILTEERDGPGSQGAWGVWAGAGPPARRRASGTQ
ncbi:hypothetical protein XI06_14450, partial [Bradyrhizobium sp. CCBAU 11434]|nr:hypothetical protein [Bradyrhizobium sp. CCBAU 11434]